MLLPDLVPPEHGTVLGETHHDKLPSAVGFTVDAFPQSVQVKEESGLPWMLVLAPTVPLPSSCSTAYPFNEPREGSTVMHQVPRCHRCHGFVSVQCPVLRGRYWECALCGHGNAIPRHAPPLYRPHMHLTPQPGEACVYEVPIPLTGPPPAPSSPGQDYLCAPLPSYLSLSPARCPALVVLVVLPEGLLQPAPVPLPGPPQPSPVPPAVPALASLLEPLLSSLRQHPSASQCRLGLWGVTGASLGVVQGPGHMSSLGLHSLVPLVQDLGGLDLLCPPMPTLLQSSATCLASSLLLGLGGGQGGATGPALHRVVALLHELAMGHSAPTIEAYRVLALCPSLPVARENNASSCSGATLATPTPRPHGLATHTTSHSAQPAQGSVDTRLDLAPPLPPPLPQGPTLLPMTSLLPPTVAPPQPKQEARQADEAVEGLRTMAQALATQARVAVSTLHQDPTTPPPLAAPLQALARATGGLWWQGDGIGACRWAVEGLGCAMAITGEVRSSEGWEVGGGQGEGGHLYSFSRAAAPPQGWGMCLGLHYSHAWGLGSTQDSRPPVVQLSVAYSVVKGTQLRRRLRVVTLRARGIAVEGASVQASACWPLVRYALLQQALALDDEEGEEGRGAEEALREWTARALTALAHSSTQRHKDETEAEEEQEALVGWGYAIEEAVVGCRGHEERRAALTHMDPRHSDRALTPLLGALDREETGKLVVQWGTEARQGGAWGVEEGHSTTLVALGSPPQADTWRAVAHAHYVKYVQGDEGWAVRCKRLWQQQQGQPSHGAQAFREAVQALLTHQPPPPSPHWASGIKHWLSALSTPLRQLSMHDAHD